MALKIPSLLQAATRVLASTIVAERIAVNLILEIADRLMRADGRWLTTQLGDS